MKIALVLTVKNEERLLRNNLLYHKEIGVGKIFVYFDNTTDIGESTISDLDFVSINKSVSVQKYDHLVFLKKFTTQATHHHTARQCLNTFDAMLECEKLGFDWLISLDADELICTDFEKPTDLKIFFEKIPLEVEVVNFAPLEVLQRKEKYNNVFIEEIFFKANRNAFKKKFYNPLINSYQQFSWWYGHNMGKGAVKIKREIIPHNVHRYKKIDGTKVIRFNSGNILHYHAYDVDDFKKKFTNFIDHPNTFLSGNKVEDLKLMLRDIVNHPESNLQSLKSYFTENLMFNEKEIAKIEKGKKYFFIKIKPIPLKIVYSVRMTFDKMNNNY